MVAKVAYEVVSEFVFEEAVALTATNSLTSAVENLSKKTDDAIFGVARLGAAYAKSFLTGGAGFLGFIGSAIKSSEKFRSTQVELANTMLANKFTVNGEVVKFNQALSISDNIMTSINKKAKNFGLSPAALTSGVKLFSNFLAPKGLAGDNFSNAIDLARVATKGVPALGIDQTNAQGQIASAIGGTLSGQTLFGNRLFAEAGDAISAATGGAVKDIKSFNRASGKVRVKALIAGLDKLAGTTDVVNARTELLTNKLMAIRDSLFGVGSILRPLGDTLNSFIGPVLDEILNQINTKGKMIVRLTNAFFKNLGDSPKELFLNVKAFANLHGDIKSAGSALRFLGVSIGLLGLAAHIGIIRSFTINMIKMRGVTGALTLKFAKFSRFFQGLLGSGLGSRLALLIPTFGVLVAIFQVLSRAADRMKIQFLEMVDLFGGKFIVQTEKFMNLISLIFKPFNDVINIFADLLGTSIIMKPIFEGVLDFFKSLNNVLQFLAIAFNSVFIALKSLGAGLGAFMGTIMDVIENPANILNADERLFKNVYEAMDNEINKGVDELVGRLLNPETGKKEVAKNITNVNMKNTFNIKEKIEPDRIAFTLESQLQKLSENRRSSIGSPLPSAGGI